MSGISIDKYPWPVGLLSSLLPSLGQERASTSVCQSLPKPKSSPSYHNPILLLAQRPHFLVLKRTLSLYWRVVFTASLLLVPLLQFVLALSCAGFGTPWSQP